MEQGEFILQHRIDWALFVELAIAHGVVSILHHNLSIVKPAGLPDDILAQLRVFAHVNALRNLVLTQDLLRLLKFLSDNNVSAIPFRGPTLSVQVYDDSSFRQFGDLDILVHRKDFLKARNLLLSEEYLRGTLSNGLESFENHDLRRMKRLGEYSPQHSSELISIDLYGRLAGGVFPALASNFESLGDDLISISLLDTQVNTFSPETLLIYLCICGSKDGWTRLSWMCDVAALISHHAEINWSHVFEEAQRLDSTQMLLLGLTLAKETLNLALPDTAERYIQTHFTNMSLTTQLYQRLMRGFDYCSVDNEHRFNVDLQLIEDKKDQLRHRIRCALDWLILIIQPNPLDQAFLELPRQFYGIYYLIRPIRLVLKLVAIKKSSKRRSLVYLGHD
ncbi:MAG: nucleotidyltransferase family protein [Leptolyngbya sp. SIO3F4]|nr:nucleotidyltransferase family protein [Leptolyngbya sp. SIO3F4]